MTNDGAGHGSNPSEEVAFTSRCGEQLSIGPIRADDVEELFNLFAEVVASGDGYPHSPPLTREVFDQTWVRPVTLVVVARRGAGADVSVAGAYYLKPNFFGKAAHIANAGYIVAAGTRGLGVGRALVEDSIWRAPLVGFDAVQFNLVFAANKARSLYEELGWVAIGRIPDAIPGDDAIIYWRRV
jgi:GNAT superfamily N-acetyltransferase